MINSMVQTFQNDLSFSLYAISSICYIVVTSEDWKKVSRRLNTNEDDRVQAEKILCQDTARTMQYQLLTVH